MYLNQSIILENLIKKYCYLGPGEDVPAGERDGDAGLLDGARLLPALLEDAHQKLPLETEVLELAALRVRHVRSLLPTVLGRELQLGLPPLLLLAHGAARSHHGSGELLLLRQGCCHLESSAGISTMFSTDHTIGNVLDVTQEWRDNVNHFAKVARSCERLEILKR